MVMIDSLSSVIREVENQGRRFTAEAVMARPVEGLLSCKSCHVKN